MIEGDKFFWWLEKVADIRNLKKKKKYSCWIEETHMNQKCQKWDSDAIGPYLGWPKTLL